MPTKARKCSACVRSDGEVVGSRPARTRFSRPPTDAGPAAARTRHPCGQCDGEYRAREAIGAGGRSHSPCPAAASPAADAGDHGGTGSVGCHARAASCPDCRACSHRRCPRTAAVRSGRRSDESSIPTCRGRSDSVLSKAPFCSPDADRVDRAPQPVQLTPRFEFVKDHAVEPRPDPVPAPLSEPTVDRLPGRAEHRRQLPPGAARRRHEDDRRQTLTVTGPASATALRTHHLSRWYHPPEKHPQLVRHQSLHEIRPCTDQRSITP